MAHTIYFVLSVALALFLDCVEKIVATCQHHFTTLVNGQIVGIMGVGRR